MWRLRCNGIPLQSPCEREVIKVASKSNKVYEKSLSKRDPLLSKIAAVEEDGFPLRAFLRNEMKEHDLSTY
jgi:hypothetical protein